MGEGPGYSRIFLKENYEKRDSAAQRKAQLYDGAGKTEDKQIEIEFLQFAEFLS